MFKLTINGRGRKGLGRQGLIGAVVAAAILMLGQSREAHAWWIASPGIYNDQGNWDGSALPIWPANTPDGMHRISVCW